MAKIRKKHLLRLGFEPGEALRLALKAMEHEAFRKKGRNVLFSLLQDLLRNPEKFRKHQILGSVVVALIGEEADPEGSRFPELLGSPIPYPVYGKEFKRNRGHDRRVTRRLPYKGHKKI